MGGQLLPEHPSLPPAAAGTFGAAPPVIPYSSKEETVFHRLWDRRARATRLSRPLVLVLGASIAMMAVLSVVAFGQIIGTPNRGHLVAVGPTEEPDGFPSWYKDDKNVRVEPCLDAQNPLCNILPDTLADPTQPVSFPDNFPNEFFLAVADNLQTAAGGGKLVTRLALEGAFANGDPAPGDQMVFGRIRFFYGGLKAGETYKITHPYGVDKFVAEQTPGAAAGVGRIRFTEDVGVTPGDFGGALNSRIGPFLKWDPATAPAAPAGYLGDPAVTHAVTGSPYQTNFLRVEGPGIAASPADQCTVTPAGENPEDCIQSDQFTISGKLATNGGVGVDRATYSRTAADTAGGTLNVFASSEVTAQSIQVSGAGFDPTRLVGENGHYDAIVPYNGATPPATVKVDNTGDVPVASKTATVTDAVKASAVYDADANTLTVNAHSSDEVTSPTLTATGYGDLGADGVLQVNTMGTPPDVTVTSKAGGKVTVPVSITGAGFPAIPVQAFAGINQEVLVGATVTLDGTASTGPVKSYNWTQTAGPAVTLTGRDTATPTFTAPDVAPDPDATLTFQLSVDGAGGPSTSTVTVHVVAGAALPVANAGADQTVAEDSIATLDGTGSTDATSYSWTQVGGPAVTLTGAKTAKPTFRFPKQNVTLTFRLTASGAAGSSTDDVQISTTPDKLTTTLVQFTASKKEWRITGTDSLFGPGVTINVHNGTSVDAGGKPNGPVIGTATVDTLGAWTVRVTSTIAPTGNPARVSIESSAGGQLVGVAVVLK